MGMAQYGNQFKDPVTLSDQKAVEEFLKLNQNADRLHFGELGELERHKQVMEKLNSIEQDLRDLKIHFKVYKIIGTNGTNP